MKAAYVADPMVKQLEKWGAEDAINHAADGGGSATASRRLLPNEMDAGVTWIAALVKVKQRSSPPSTFPTIEHCSCVDTMRLQLQAISEPKSPGKPFVEDISGPVCGLT